jgi:LysM repeat protein
MRVRTWSACVLLAWGIILIIMTAVGSTGPFRPAQANIRIASSTSNTSSKTTIATQVTLTSSVTTSPTARPRTATAAATIAPPAASSAVRTDAGARADSEPRSAAGSYVVQPGDTLSGIATALGIRGGWPALYADNRPVVGPDPGLISVGTVLALPGPAAPARYTVAAGRTLSGIADALATPGGWPALYAANRRVIGADPNAIQVGMVLAIPRRTPVRPLSPAPHRAPSGSPAPRPAPTPTKAPASASASAHPPTLAVANGHPRPGQANPPNAAGLPRWLEIVLVAAGLLIGTAFLTEPTRAIARRRRAARPAAASARIVLADYDRLVVTHCGTDGTVCVLRPPGADPQAILLAARLVLAQDRYEELAGHLGVPAHWPRE